MSVSRKQKFGDWGINNLENEEYDYINVPLTPKVAKPLILELFSGRTATNQTIFNEIKATHLARGGKEPKAQDNPRLLKPALKQLKKDGIAKNPSQGHWSFVDSESKNNEVNVLDTDFIQSQEIEIRKEIKEDFNADLVLGKGASTVYLYYLPSYQERRESITWACKIGRSDKDPLKRIINQAATALPEKPKVAVIIKTNNSIVLEQAIHSILTYRNKKIETGMGKEWFDTNPEEFLKIVQFIEQSTLLFE